MFNKKIRSRSSCFLGALVLASSANADTNDVPLDGDIQAAIVAASDGDIIQLEAGTYFVSTTIDTLGKGLTILGATDPQTGEPTSIIDGQESTRVLQCINEDDPVTTFENLVISNGWHHQQGGGISCSRSSPTLRNCRFESCEVSPYGAAFPKYGGGMFNSFSNPTLTDCTFIENSAAGYGGGMYNIESSPTLENCAFSGNVAEDLGGGMYNNYGSSPMLAGCTFIGNSATDDGGGMRNHRGCYPILTNCTFEQNSANEGGGIFSDTSSAPMLSDTVVCENTQQQIFGPWTDNGGNTVTEECPDGTCPADLDGNGTVNAADLTILLATWGLMDVPADLDGSGVVDAADLTVLLAAWGACP